MLVLEVRPHASSQRRAYPVISVRLWISWLVSEDDTISNDNYSQCHRSSTDSAAGMGVIMDVITCTNLIRLQYLNGHWASVRRHLFLGGFLHSVAVTMSRFLVPICSSSCKCLCRMGLGFHSDCLRFCYLPGWLCCVVLLVWDYFVIIDTWLILQWRELCVLDRDICFGFCFLLFISSFLSWLTENVLNIPQGVFNWL